MKCGFIFKTGLELKSELDLKSELASKSAVKFKSGLGVKSGLEFKSGLQYKSGLKFRLIVVYFIGLEYTLNSHIRHLLSGMQKIQPRIFIIIHVLELSYNNFYRKKNTKPRFEPITYRTAVHNHLTVVPNYSNPGNKTPVLIITDIFIGRPSTFRNTLNAY